MTKAHSHTDPRLCPICGLPFGNLNHGGFGCSKHGTEVLETGIRARAAPALLKACEEVARADMEALSYRELRTLARKAHAAIQDAKGG